jgi:hypothetical protein
MLKLNNSPQFLYFFSFQALLFFILFTGSKALKCFERFHYKVLLNNEYKEIESENYFKEIQVDYLDRFYKEAQLEIERCEG